jgi:ureidoacrylate peracid hydrolase
MDILEERLNPQTAALLVVDMQNDFCAEGGYLQRRRNYDVGFADGLVKKIGDVVAAARRAGMRVVWIRSVYDFKDLGPAEIAKRGEEGCCLEGTWGTDFFKLSPAPDEAIIDKHSFNAFRNTKLDDYLRDNGIRTLVMTGVATNVCVDSTLREGFFRGYHIVVLEDCVGSNSQAGHEGTLATVRNNIGRVIPSAAATEVLTRAAASQAY